MQPLALILDATILRRKDLRDRDAGAIPAASTFSAQASTGDCERQDTFNRSDGEGVASHDATVFSRKEATASVGSRPARATESATSLLNDDADLATVVAAWPGLPDTVRAGILAMVTGPQHLKNPT